MPRTKKTLEEKPKKRSGPPTKYRANFHPQDFIERSKQGKHVRQICRDWDIDSSQIYRWAQKYDEMRSALKKGREYLEAFYMDWFYEMANMPAQMVNTTAAIFLSKNTVKWTDRIEESHKVDAITKIEFVDEQ